MIFGPKRLPELGKSLGSGMKSFKDSVTGDDDDKKLTTGDTKPDTTVRAEKSETSAVAEPRPAAARVGTRTPWLASDP